MRKVLFVALFIGIAVQVAPPMPGQYTGTAGNGSDKSAQQRQGDKTAANPSAIVGPRQSPVDPSGKAQGVAPQDKEQSVNLTNVPPITIVDKPKTWKDRLFDWGPWVFNLLLVLVGGAAVWVAHWTRVAIERQADLMNRQACLMETQSSLMERQTNIMAAPFDQWVELFNWRVDRPIASRLLVEVDLINKSAFPMTLNDSYVQFRSFVDQSMYVKYGTGETKKDNVQKAN